MLLLLLVTTAASFSSSGHHSSCDASDATATGADVDVDVLSSPKLDTQKICLVYYHL